MSRIKLLLGVELVVCFGPILLLWLLGVGSAWMLFIDREFTVVTIFSTFFVPFLLLLGGLGLYGIYRLIRYVYDSGQGVWSQGIYVYIGAGIVSCLGLVISNLLDGRVHFILVIFITPILSAMHLLYLAKRKSVSMVGY